MSELQVNKISPQSGTAITLGNSGDTFTIPSGATLTNNGTATGFGASGNTGQFRVYIDSYTLANNTNTTVSGWTKQFDLSNYFASDKYTPTEAGKYFFTYSARFNNVQIGNRFKIGLEKNGVEVSRANGEITNARSGGTYPTVGHSIIIDANGTSDYFKIMMFQNVGVSAGIFDLTFEGFMLSA